MCVICVILGGGYMFDGIGSVHMSHLRRRIHVCHMCHIRRRIHVRWHRQCAYVASAPRAGHLRLDTRHMRKRIHACHM